MMLVLVVALIMLGPKQLPTIARMLGLAIGRWRQFSAQIQQYVDQQIKLDQLQRNEERARQAELAQHETRLD